MEDVYEQFFALMYYGRWDFQQAYNLPVQLRTWFVKRLVQQKEKERESVRGNSNTTTHTLGPGSPSPKF